MEVLHGRNECSLHTPVHATVGQIVTENRGKK
jgi:hypothetical protein